MASRFVFFCGPTIAADWVQQQFARFDAEIDVRAPAEQGSILGCLASSPDLICLIDGCFHQVPSVLHKEILFAIELGIAVCGAASMGALRAAELHDFGMQGFGKVYQMYLQRVIDGDDEVAIVHGPKEMDYEPLSEALVNVRQHVADARLRRVISARLASRIVSSMKRLPYYERLYERTLPTLVVEERDAREVEAFRNYLAHQAFDQKRRDAEDLVKAMVQRAGAEKLKRPTLRTRLHHTRYLAMHRNHCVGQELDGSVVLESQALSIQKLCDDAIPAVVKHVRINSFLARDSALRQLTIPSVQALLARFRESGGLTSAEEFQKWLQARRMSRRELEECLIERELVTRLEKSRRVSTGGETCDRQALFEEVCRSRGVAKDDVLDGFVGGQQGEFDAALLREIKLLGSFGKFVEQAIAIETLFSRLAMIAPDLIASITMERAESWLCRQWGIALEQLDHVLVKRGVQRGYEYGKSVCGLFARAASQMLAGVWSKVSGATATLLPPLISKFDTTGEPAR